MIDVTKPLELSDGRKVYFEKVDNDNDIIVRDLGDGKGSRCFFSNGIHRFGKLPNLRNVPEPAAQPLYDRLVALVERIARDEVVANAEARAIMAELRPVDPDLIEARKIATGIHSDFDYTNGDFDKWPICRATLAAIKRGRELAEKGNG